MCLIAFFLSQFVVYMKLDPANLSLEYSHSVTLPHKNSVFFSKCKDWCVFRYNALESYSRSKSVN